MTIREYISDWDPMGYIAEGYSEDEYDAEADEIAKRFKPKMSDKELADLVHNIFVEYMEIDPIGFRDESSRRASSIRKLLT